MKEILKIVIQNLSLLYVPAVGALLALVLLAIKKRYVRQGYLFRPSSVSSREHQPSTIGETATSAVCLIEQELHMTTPTERTNAVIETRRFLQLLASDDGLRDVGNIRETAIRLLRHYPRDIDLSVSSSAFPSVWSSPKT